MFARYCYLTLTTAVTIAVGVTYLLLESTAVLMSLDLTKFDGLHRAVTDAFSTLDAIIVDTFIISRCGFAFPVGDDTDQTTCTATFGQDIGSQIEGTQTAGIGGMTFRPVGNQIDHGISGVIMGRHAGLISTSSQSITEVVTQGILELFPFPTGMDPFRRRPIHVRLIGFAGHFGRR